MALGNSGCHRPYLPHGSDPTMDWCHPSWASSSSPVASRFACELWSILCSLVRVNGNDYTHQTFLPATLHMLQAVSEKVEEGVSAEEAELARAQEVVQRIDPKMPGAAILLENIRARLNQLQPPKSPPPSDEIGEVRTLARCKFVLGNDQGPSTLVPNAFLAFTFSCTAQPTREKSRKTAFVRREKQENI